MDKTYYLIVEYENDSNNAQDQEQGKTYRVKINFVTELLTITKQIAKIAETSNEIVEDDYGNLRYIGADPNNYVLFNNELWRIIGVMKDIENADGSKSDKVKLVKNEIIGQLKFDNKNNTGSSKNIYGSNDWSDSQLMMMLNPDTNLPSNYTIDNNRYVLDSNRNKIYRNPGSYYNRTNGYQPNTATITSFTETEVDFSSTGLTNESKEMISEVVWNLGGSDSNSKLTHEFYTLERRTMVFGGNSTKWTGHVGLMYPSDYGYATSGGTTTDRTTCLDTKLSEIYRLSDCYNNNWLYNNKYSQWLITPYNTNDIHLFVITNSGDISAGSVEIPFQTHITIYLNSNIVIENEEEGSSASPFILK